MCCLLLFCDELIFFPPVLRRKTEDIFEGAGEIQLVWISDLFGHISYWYGGVLKELGSLVHAVENEKLLQSLIQRFFKNFAKIALAVGEQSAREAEWKQQCWLKALGQLSKREKSLPQRVAGIQVRHKAVPTYPWALTLAHFACQKASREKSPE